MLDKLLRREGTSEEQLFGKISQYGEEAIKYLKKSDRDTWTIGDNFQRGLSQVRNVRIMLQHIINLTEDPELKFYAFVSARQLALMEEKYAGKTSMFYWHNREYIVDVRRKLSEYLRSVISDFPQRNYNGLLDSTASFFSSVHDIPVISDIIIR